jgi:hypothetical protein
VHTSSAPEFRAANDRLIRIRRAEGPVVALDDFLTTVIGADWRAVIERHVAGAAEQMERDTVTFFDTDLPELLDWRFGPPDARQITCPVLHVVAPTVVHGSLKFENSCSAGCRTLRTSWLTERSTRWRSRMRRRSPKP